MNSSLQNILQILVILMNFMNILTLNAFKKNVDYAVWIFLL